MAVKVLTKDTWKQVENDQWAVIDFYADWCAPCSMISPIVEKLSDEYTDVCFYKVDIDHNMELASNYRIMSIPALLFFKQGEKVNEVIGYMTEEQLKNELDKTFV
ncbi:MAG: thioredoxin [Lachnospiraceae bacterium]|nr:thioredoxin [Lachnospiraceae bacterium]